MHKDKSSLDPSLEKYYAEGNERDRLSSHRLEKDRTLRILKKVLPPSPAIIIDVGGAAGVYAFELAQLGYGVHLIDPVALHIHQAKEHARISGHSLASYAIGDARHIEREKNSADVVLFFGPLYHLADPADRHKALSEAYRVLKPGGLLLAVGISRFASFMDAAHKNVIDKKFTVIKEEFASGVHRKIAENMIFAYLHRPEELKDEVLKSGFCEATLCAIEGPVWEKNIIEAVQDNEKSWEQLLTLLDQIETEETILGASAHIMAIARVGNPKHER